MTIKRLFWISEEKRLGAFWRIGLQTILMMVSLMVFGTPIILLTQRLPGDLSTSWQLLLALRFLNQLLILLAIVGSAWLGGRFLDGRRFSDFGLRFNRDWWLDFGFGLLLGAFLMGLIFLIEWSAGWVTITGRKVTPSTSFPFWLAVLYQIGWFGLVAIEEEMLFRGYHLKNLAEGLVNIQLLSSKTAILLSLIFSSIGFGFLHINNPNATWVSTLNIAGGGILLGLGYILTGELAIPIALHITWNFFQGNVFGFPVSGVANGVSFLSIQQGGPDLYTGGAFGPEAGLIGVAAVALGCVLVLGYVRWRYGNIHLRETLTAADFLPRKKQKLTALRAQSNDNAAAEKTQTTDPLV